MKVLNHTRLIKIVRNYILTFLVSFSVFSGFNIYFHEKTNLWTRLIDPKFLGQNILGITMWSLTIMFMIYLVFCVFHLLMISKNEYLNVWHDFIEGPDQNGIRKVFSFSQIEYAGRDVLGRFTLVSGDEKIVLPGKLSVSCERDILRKIKSAQSEHHL